MKYYLYISDTKVDMLYEQIPHDGNMKTSTEFGFDLKFAKASRKVEEETESNRYTRLDTVLQVLQDSGEIGSLDDPREYVRAQFPMRFAPWGSKAKAFRWGSRSEQSKSTAQFVCFVGKTGDFEVLLWGSAKHMLGSSQDTNPGCWHSSTSLATFAMWDFFDRINHDVDWRIAPTKEEETNFADLRKYGTQWRGIRANFFAASDEALAVLATRTIYGELLGPDQMVEFVAKRFQHTSSSFLGTPLYVALSK
jgi:hypothetical protein